MHTILHVASLHVHGGFRSNSLPSIDVGGPGLARFPLFPVQHGMHAAAWTACLHFMAVNRKSVGGNGVNHPVAERACLPRLTPLFKAVGKETGDTDCHEPHQSYSDLTGFHNSFAGT